MPLHRALFLEPGLAGAKYALSLLGRCAEEVRLPLLPPAADAALRFIGRIRSDWGPGDCPRNLRAARESGGGAARVELDPVYAPALLGLAPGDAILVLYWMDRARRDLLVQSPGHIDGTRGTFALRSPNRPNPVSLAAVRITAIAGTTMAIDAIDAFDGTPVIHINPWRPGIDIPPGIGGQAPRDAPADR